MRAKGVLNLPSRREEELLQDYAFTPLREDFVSFFL